MSMVGNFFSPAQSFNKYVAWKGICYGGGNKLIYPNLIDDFGDELFHGLPCVFWQTKWPTFLKKSVAAFGKEVFCPEWMWLGFFLQSNPIKHKKWRRLLMFQQK